MGNINWKYFVAAAEERNFTRAAAKLFISQQSLSNYIVKLETTLGVELFSRKNNLSLTEAGESLYANAKKILVMEELAEKEILDIRDFRTSSLRIGVSRQRGSMILPAVLPELKLKYPELKVEVVEKRLKELQKELLEGSVDLMFGYAEEKHPDLVYEVYDQEKLVLIIADSLWNQYFSPEKQEELLKMDKVPLDVFDKCPFVLLKEGGWMTSLIHKYCAKTDLNLNEVFYTLSIDTMINLALVGFGITVCPAIYLRDEFIDKIAREPIHIFELEDPMFMPERAIIYMKKRYLPKVARDFIDIAKVYRY